MRSGNRELNDLARRLDEQGSAVELRESLVEAPDGSSDSQLTENARRILAAIEQLPEEEREVFNLVRVQGLSQPEAAAVAGVSAKTVQRRLNRCQLLLAAQLADLRGHRRQGRGSGEDKTGADEAAADKGGVHGRDSVT